MKKYLLLLGITFALFCYLVLTHESYSLPREVEPQLKWRVLEAQPIAKELLLEKLNQPYRFLKEGGQMRVYTSEDGTVVLKLFKFNRLKPAWWSHFLPPNRRKSHIQRRQQRFDQAFYGHQVASHYLWNESGLLLMQLQPGFGDYEVEIINQIGHRSRVDLGHNVFVLQERAELLSNRFDRLLSQGNIHDVKRDIEKIADLYRVEYQKGVFDTDHGVTHNVGFVGDCPLHVDLGGFVEDSRMKVPAHAHADFVKVMGKLTKWTDTYYPEHATEIYEHVQAILDLS